MNSACRESTNILQKNEKFVCCICSEPITDIVIQALDKTYHTEHFICVQCKKPITSSKYNINDNKIYCENDYAMLFLKKCAACSMPIRDIVIVAVGRTWHKEHFVCYLCGNSMSNKGFFEHNNEAYCQSCYKENICPKCFGCQKPIIDVAVLALSQKWHSDCFKCTNCDTSVADKHFELTDNKPVCMKCSVIAARNKMISK